MATPLVILGGPGDGIVVAQAVRDLAIAGKDIRVAGFLNDAVPKGQLISGAAVLGTLDEWHLLSAECLFIPALHKVKQMPARVRRLRELQIPDSRWASVVHPTARVADGVDVGQGSFLASFVTVQPGARIGAFASIRAGANVGHDAMMDDFAYMGPNSTLSGRARLLEGAHLGPNACVIDGMTVGRYAVVGACSAATKNIEDFSICMGVPARPVSVARQPE